MQEAVVTEFKFYGRISKMGKDKYGDRLKVIWIPKEYHKDITKLEGKTVRIRIDDEI